MPGAWSDDSGWHMGPTTAWHERRPCAEAMSKAAQSLSASSSENGVR